ncbi:hypothetical protein SLEP1_g35289 [Rubroshorea leprosula]|uniref:Uncharacterized protein n=1 Tax=Rubroshorea leprosula TaxID=152421 RepID=A0AAV5KN89_9ROSI|nr:hypothetical protein SLEP1_g35289 [Rubroshorea leprosula]
MGLREVASCGERKRYGDQEEEVGDKRGGKLCIREERGDLRQQLRNRGGVVGRYDFNG